MPTHSLTTIATPHKAHEVIPPLPRAAHMFVCQHRTKLLAFGDTVRTKKKG